MKNKKPIIQSQIVDWKGFKIEVTGQYEEGDTGVWTFPNGDPSYPPTSSNFYIEGISLIEGELLELIDVVQGYKKDVIEELENLVIEKIEEL